ncbi:MAG: putative quinol monooxygenase [Ignavibacteria bacterium]
MKINKFLIIILPLMAFLLVSCRNTNQETINKDISKNLIVLVKYKSQLSKSKEAVEGLTKLIEAVKTEPDFVNITLHVDPKDDSNILLYEEWSNESYYNGAHMKTEHLQKFMEDSRAFLAGPPEISQWKIEKVFNAK